MRFYINIVRKCVHMENGKLRAVFYARVSTEEEQQLNAIEKQIEENRDVISDKGWILVD